MICSIADLKNKQVVSVETGVVLGYVGDIEINTETGEISSVVIFGKQKLMGILGKEEDITISWKNIKVIGEETVLVSGPVQFSKQNK